jgi:hypothetical protein
MRPGRELKDGREQGRITSAPNLDLTTRYPRTDNDGYRVRGWPTQGVLQAEAAPTPVRTGPALSRWP